MTIQYTALASQEASKTTEVKGTNVCSSTDLGVGLAVLEGKVTGKSRVETTIAVAYVETSTNHWGDGYAVVGVRVELTTNIERRSYGTVSNLDTARSEK